MFLSECKNTYSLPSTFLLCNLYPDLQVNQSDFLESIAGHRALDFGDFVSSGVIIFLQSSLLLLVLFCGCCLHLFDTMYIAFFARTDFLRLSSAHSLDFVSWDIREQRSNVSWHVVQAKYLSSANIEPNVLTENGVLLDRDTCEHHSISTNHLSKTNQMERMNAAQNR